MLTAEVMFDCPKEISLRVFEGLDDLPKGWRRLRIEKQGPGKPVLIVLGTNTLDEKSGLLVERTVDTLIERISNEQEVEVKDGNL